MKKLVLVFTLAAFALAGAASAQDPNYFDNIGIYADEEATTNCATLGINTVQTLYVALTKLTNPEVYGWEAKFSFEGMGNSQVTVLGDAVDAGSREGEHIVGLATPLIASGGTVVVATVDVFLIEFVHDPALPSYAFVEGVYFGALPGGLPTYLPVPEAPMQLHPSTIDGHEGGPVFFLNNGCDPVAVEQDTWGGVKSLYR